jgi:hypothetical protein
MSELAVSIAVNCALGAILFGVLRWRVSGDTVRLEGPADAMQQFARHFPGAAGTATVADDGRSALIELQRGRIGLLQRLGRRWNARTLIPGDVSKVEASEDGTLRVKFADFAWPGAQLRIGHAEIRSLWVARLQSLATRGASRESRGASHA